MASKIKSTAPRRRRQRKGAKAGPGLTNDEGDVDSDVEAARGPEGEVLWAVGNVSDDDDDADDEEGLDDDIDHHQHPIHNKSVAGNGHIQPAATHSTHSQVGEHTGLVAREEDEDEEEEEEDGWVKHKVNDNDERRRRRSMDPFRDVDDEHELEDYSTLPKR